MNAYQFWQESLDGLKPKMYVDDPRLGFYRRGVYERDAKGNNRRKDWLPVAIFMDNTTMTALVGMEVNGKYVTGDELNTLWTWVAGNPISEGAWIEAARLGKPWPDAHDPSKNKSALNAEQASAQNDWERAQDEAMQPLIDATERLAASVVYSNRTITTQEDADTIKEQIIIREINEAKAGVSQYDKIDSDEMAGRALSLKNEITTLAGKLDKIREGLVRPHVDAQAEINGKYNPIIKDAKAQGPILLGAIGKWEDTKREAQRRAEIEQRRRDEEARKAQEWNEAAPPGSIPEPIKTEPPIQSNAPQPKAQVAAAVGRKASVKIAKFVTDVNIDKAFAQFRNEAGLKLLLIDFAQKAVNAGLSVDGATIEERSVVR
jgi:hypothetical protein